MFERLFGRKDKKKENVTREPEIQQPVTPEPEETPAPVPAVPELTDEQRMELNQKNLKMLATAIEKLRGKLPDLIEAENDGAYRQADTDLEAFLQKLEEPASAVLDLKDLDENAARALENLAAILQNNEVNADGRTTWETVLDLLKDALLENRYSGNPSKILLARAEIAQVRLYEELADKKRFSAKLKVEEARLKKILGKLYTLENPTATDIALQNSLQTNLQEVQNDLTANGQVEGYLMGKIKSSQLHVDKLRNYSTFNTETEDQTALHDLEQLVDDQNRDLEEQIQKNAHENSLSYQKQKMREKRLEESAAVVTSERMQDLQNVVQPETETQQQVEPTEHDQKIRDEVYTL